MMTHGVSGYVQKCRCLICEKGHRAYHRARNFKLYEAGKCRHCTAERFGKFVLCAACLEDARNYQARRRRQTQEAAA